jgi:hypothetical protein
MTEVVHMNDDNLCLRIRTKFLRHQLPTESPSKTWGGRATNEICAVCDDNILGMSEIEAESADGRRGSIISTAINCCARSVGRPG